MLGLLLGVGEGLITVTSLDGLAVGVVVAYQLTGGVISGILAWAFVIPVVIIFAPVARWALGVSFNMPPDDQITATRLHEARAMQEAPSP